MKRPEHKPLHAAVPFARYRLPRLPRPAWLTRTILVLALGFSMALSVVPAAAWAQEPAEPTPTEVTVTTEPGPCANLGSFCERLLDWTGNEAFAETVAWLVGTPVKLMAISGLAVLANTLARRAIRSSTIRFETMELPEQLVSDRSADRSQQRADAVGAMLRSSASALIFGIAAIAFLGTLGISVIPVLASLGIVGIAVGFGAQSLIEDLISGVMLVVEDQLGVGDRVDVGEVEGVVERLTLRSTVILAPNGVRWYVPNSEIRRVANESQHKGRASVQLRVSYDTDLRAATAALHQAVVAMAEEESWEQAEAEDIRQPFVAELGDGAVVLEIRLFVEPTQRRPFEQALRERLVQVAADAQITLPTPELDVNIRSEPGD